VNHVSIAQVVLLEGQAIWYYHPDHPLLGIPEGNKFSHVSRYLYLIDFDDLILLQLRPIELSREDFGLENEWFIFFCPQSVFKMHPLFDFVFADILRAIPNAHLVVTGFYSYKIILLHLIVVSKVVEKNHGQISI
jgi:hypothetical protein